MQTPNTPAGLLTEEVMAQVHRRVSLTVGEYNAVYSAVLETLSVRLPEIEESKQGMSRKEFLAHL